MNSGLISVSRMRATAQSERCANTHGETGDESYANEFLLNTVLPLMPPQTILSATMADGILRRTCVLTTFGIRGMSTHCAQEKEGLWTARLNKPGDNATRIVAAAPTADVVDHMKKEGIIGMEAKDFLRDAKAETLAKFFDQGRKMCFATLGANDMAVTPAHHLILEAVQTEEDVIGLRAGLVCPADIVGFSKFEQFATLVSTPSSHISKGVSKLKTVA